MSHNQISAASIKKLIKKLKKRRRADPDSLELLSRIVVYTSAFLTFTAQDIAGEKNSDFLKNKDLRKAFVSIGLEKLFDSTFADFMAEYVNK